MFAAPLDRACDFLTAFLEDGAKSAREVWLAAEKEDLSERTLRRAKKERDIRSVRVWAGGSRLSYWLLPGQQMPETVSSEAIVPDLEPWLAPLRERFPPSTPIDDA